MSGPFHIQREQNQNKKASKHPSPKSNDNNAPLIRNDQITPPNLYINHISNHHTPSVPFIPLPTEKISLPSLSKTLPELADSQDPPTLEETTNQRVVLRLYDALSSRDVDTVQKLLAPDLEWWFHGPPSHQFMMRLLTGHSATSSKDSFHFVPQSVAAFGSIVLVEGCDHCRSISWVHAWTVTNGIITQVREYFNTSLTVTRLSSTAQSSPSNCSSTSSSSSSSSISSLHCPFVWESSVSNRVGKSVPGLVLAI